MLQDRTALFIIWMIVPGVKTCPAMPGDYVVSLFSAAVIAAVGNIPFDATEMSMREFFESYKYSVRSVRLLTERDTNRPRGIGYIEFFDEATAQAVLRNMSKIQMGGRTLRIDQYDPGATVRARDARYNLWWWG